MDIESYVRGFNVGYDLKKEDPKLYNSLVNAFSSQSDYLQGILEGAKEYDKEQMRHKVRNHYNRSKQQDHSNDNEMDRDR
jgi:hypothetical protein